MLPLASCVCWYIGTLGARQKMKRMKIVVSVSWREYVMKSRNKDEGLRGRIGNREKRERRKKRLEWTERCQEQLETGVDRRNSCQLKYYTTLLAPIDRSKLKFSLTFT